MHRKEEVQADGSEPAEIDLPQPVIVDADESTTVKSTTEKRGPKKAAVASENGLKKRKTAAAKQDRPASPEIESQREIAMPRRLDWTPPGDTKFVPMATQADASDSVLEIQPTPRGESPSKGVFETLFDTYACPDVINKAPEIVSVPTESVLDVIKKRKRAESPEKQAAEPARAASPTKASAPRRKVRTITELATAPYAMNQQVELLAPGNQDSLLKYFDDDGDVRALVEFQTSKMEFAAERSQKQPAKPKRSRKKAKEVEEPVLLSPQTARNQSAAMDFVFGTSSQLVLENSPTMLRDLQSAMKVSNEVDPFASSPTPAPVARKGLWHVGARDSDGTLLEAEVIELSNDLTKRPPPLRNPTETTVVEQPADKNEALPDAAPVGPPEPPKKLAVKPKASKATGARGASKAADRSAPAASKAVPKGGMPRYELMTDLELSKKVYQYGFKAVKSRQAQVALLTRCWQSQHAVSAPQPAAAAAMSTSASVSAKAVIAASPKKRQTKSAAKEVAPISKKPRGRPKKVTEAKATEPDGDAAAATTPTKKPRGRPKKDQTTNPPAAPATAANPNQ